MKKKVVGFVDGFNLYYSLQKSQNNQYHKYKWLNLRALLERYIHKQEEELKDIYYFTALHKNEQRRKRHLTYIKALRNEGVEDVRGYLRYDSIDCPKCKQTFTYPIEKQTDANIISRALSMAMYDDFDIALIVSADSDLVPMVKAAKVLKPDKQFRVIIPIHQKAKELTQACGERRKIREEHLANSQLAETITLPDGTILTRPDNWK